MTYSPLALVALVALVTLVTLATAPSRAASLSFEAAAGCPSRDDFVSSVARRGGSLEAGDAAERRTFEVVIHREGDAYVGTLTADSDALAQGEERKLRGSTCADVVEALAIALAVELQAEHSAPVHISLESQTKDNPDRFHPVPSHTAVWCRVAAT